MRITLKSYVYLKFLYCTFVLAQNTLKTQLPSKFYSIFNARSQTRNLILWFLPFFTVIMHHSKTYKTLRNTSASHIVIITSVTLPGTSQNHHKALSTLRFGSVCPQSSICDEILVHDASRANMENRCDICTTTPMLI